MSEGMLLAVSRDQKTANDSALLQHQKELEELKRVRPEAAASANTEHSPLLDDKASRCFSNLVADVVAKMRMVVRLTGYRSRNRLFEVICEFKKDFSCLNLSFGLNGLLKSRCLNHEKQSSKANDLTQNAARGFFTGTLFAGTHQSPGTTEAAPVSLQGRRDGCS